MKKLLFVIESLAAAGGEKSLVTLLSLIDFTKYQVDLQLFAYGGEFEQFVPQQVNLLPPFPYTLYLMHQRRPSIRMLLARLRYSYLIRKKKVSIAEEARYYWKCIASCIQNNPQLYDVAIAYGQCSPTFYVAEKVYAKKKMAWVNCIFPIEGDERSFHRPFYESMDKIVMVSPTSLKHLQNVFPDMVWKMDMIPDMISPQTIFQMAKGASSFTDDYNGPRLLTVARLNKEDKGYDITLEACRILKERNIKFKWYALGRGEYRSEMEIYISENHLEDYFVFLGVTPNPYPYFKNCTLYVQTSRHEGYGLSIAEARLLNRPVVTTEFDAVWAQMVQGENGLVVPLDPVAVADAIERLLNDHLLYNHIVAYQQQEKKGNIEEIEKFYQLIEE